MTHSVYVSMCSFYTQHYHNGSTHFSKLSATNCRELLYGTDYLCVDTYFRSYMDVEGYVPMALLCSYPNIACYATPIEELVQKLAAKEDSLLEVDSVNETVRLKEGWEKVIYTRLVNVLSVCGVRSSDFIAPQLFVSRDGAC